MIYSGFSVNLRKHFARLLFASTLLLCASGLHAQHIEKLRHEDCTDLCAHSRVFNSGIGIYNQDERVHDYDVKFYGIELEVIPSSTYLIGNVRVKAEVTAPQIQYFVLELTQELLVSQVVFEGQSLAYSHQDQVLEINLGQEYASGHTIDLEITYQGIPQPIGFFSGIQSAGNAFGDPVLWTLSEPHNARQWFPCKQVLADKADSVFVTVITPAGFMAASNGLLMAVNELPDDKIRYEWRTVYPIAYYLISIAVSNYQEHNFYAPLAQGLDSVFVQNFIYNHPTVLENNREALERTKGFMHVFSQVWGDYPFKNEKYGHAQAPMGGAMEHQTISTMGSLGFDITAHELAHHWFGNHVTCASWSDIWINEGFASYGEFLAREFLEGQETAKAWMNAAHNNIKSEPDGSIFVPPYELGNIWRIFNGRLSYKKGAAILHLLRFELDNDQLFFQIMVDFQQSFAHDVATGDDFRRTIDLNTGQNWEWFFDQWYYGEGYPIYELQWWQESGKLIIRSSQTTSATFPDFFKGTIEFKVVAQGEEHSLHLFQDKPLQLFEIPIPGQIEEVVFNPRSYMLMYYTLADSTGIIVPHENNLPQVKPNPFVDQLFLQVPDSWLNSSFFIADLQGRIMFEGRILLNEQEIQTSKFRAGIYLLALTAPSGETHSFKLVRY